MPKAEPNKNLKRHLENILAIVIALLLVVGAGIVLTDYFLDTSAKRSLKPLESDVLGASRSDGDDILQIETNSSDSDLIGNDSILLSSGFQHNNVFLFDNANREFIEGKTLPNSYVELNLGGKVLNTKSDPNGFFSFTFPENTLQFSKSELSVFDEDFQIIKNYRFVIILRTYFGRTYFVLPDKQDVFSLELDEKYTSPRDEFDHVQTNLCKASLDNTVNEDNFSFFDDTDVVIFPYTITSLDYEENKYTPFRIEDQTSLTTLDECITDWREYETTLAWHTSTIEEIFSSSIVNFKNNPVSSPVN